MFVEDILLVHYAAEKYGARVPLVDLGGACPAFVADYEHDRVGLLDEKPFREIDPDYRITSPQQGDPYIEDMPERDHYGMALCFSVLEHAEYPQAVFEGIERILQPGGLAIVTSVFEYPLHESSHPDLWRFSPRGLFLLATRAGLSVLETGFHVDVADGKLADGRRGPVKGVFMIARKGEP